MYAFICNFNNKLITDYKNNTALKIEVLPHQEYRLSVRWYFLFI